MTLFGFRVGIDGRKSVCLMLNGDLALTTLRGCIWSTCEKYYIIMTLSGVRSSTTDATEVRTNWLESVSAAACVRRAWMTHKSTLSFSRLRDGGRI